MLAERVDFGRYGKAFQEGLVQLIFEDRPFADQITEVLDINFLDVNFFEDLLAIIEEIDQLDSDNLSTGTLVQGTEIGQDLETQIITLLQGDAIAFQRKVVQNAQLTVDASQGYTIILIQDGKYQQIVVNGGGNSTITITQGSG